MGSALFTEGEVYLRDYQPEDAPALWRLFFDTVRRVNRREYSAAQVEAWASEDIDPLDWQALLDHNRPFIVEQSGRILGYADLQPDGLIDHFFCHRQAQGKGVGTRLMVHIELQAQYLGLNALHAHVSLTAEPFFKRFGFEVVKREVVQVRGQTLSRCLMRRDLSSK
ncbi:GNAT family N-acetyltransferase [Marinobacterium stanieri]|uniref:GNAT family N-acetyltransferase n=1 Tax=Marinobacterium stanieri TaxID=49186 RepID=UPI003A9069A3